MDLLDLLSDTGGTKSLGNIAGQLGIGQSQTKDLVGALAPSLMRSLQKQTESGDSLAGLKNALAKGNHQRYIDEPELMMSDESRADGNKILGHLFGSKDVSRNVAAQASKSTGIDSGLIKKALPLVAGLVMGAVSKKSNGGRDVDATSGGLLGGLMGSMLGGGDGDVGIDDVLGMVKKFL